MRLTNKALAIIGMTAALLSGALVSAVAGQPEKVTICHAAGQSGTTKFVTLTLPRNAVYGQAGHFNEDGTTQAGHEDDYEGACVTPTTSTSSSTSSSITTTSTSAVTTTVAPSSTTTVTVPPSTTTTLPKVDSSSTTTTTVLSSTTTVTVTSSTVSTPTTSLATSTSVATTTTMTELPNTGPEDLPIPLALSLVGGGVLLLSLASLLGRRASGSRSG